MTQRHMSEIIRRRPVAVHGEATVQEACALMREHRIGAVLVVDAEGRLEGIFSGRDAVKLLADGRNPAHTHVGNVMTRDPDYLGPGCTAIEALRLMQDGGFRHVPIVDGGKVVGIVSLGDFRSFEHSRLDEETGFWERI
jgi:CBS domain-containing protein